LTIHYSKSKDKTKSNGKANLEANWWIKNDRGNI